MDGRNKVRFVEGYPTNLVTRNTLSIFHVPVTQPRYGVEVSRGNLYRGDSESSWRLLRILQ